MYPSVDTNDLPLSSSLPSALDNGGGSILQQRSASAQGQYVEMSSPYKQQQSSGYNDPRRKDRQYARASMHPNLATVPADSALAAPSASNDRAPSPEGVSPSEAPKPQKAKISGPMNGTPIPAGYKFGAKDVPSDSGISDRERKAKSRNLWPFGRAGNGILPFICYFWDSSDIFSCL